MAVPKQRQSHSRTRKREPDPRWAALRELKIE